MKLYFIPNWNGHLYLNEYEDNSVRKLFNKIDLDNKSFIEPEKNNIEETNNKIEREAKFDDSTLSITGDHSNTFPLVKKFAKNNNNFKLVIFDAHPDVEIGTDVVSHEDYLRNLIENNIVKPENIYIFGLRTFSRVELEYLIYKKVNFFTISEMIKDKEKIIKVLKNIKGDIYLSIDIDVLDPDVAPGTYYREWCGLNLEELKEYISCLKPKAIDITEYFEEKDKDEKTFRSALDLINTFLN
jgi:agmatinase